jgi:hypothetical protein
VVHAHHCGTIQIEQERREPTSEVLRSLDGPARLAGLLLGMPHSVCIYTAIFGG